MQVQHGQSQDEVIDALRRQVEELSAENSLLTEQLARKEQFTAMIAHELRSPLTPIINYAQIIARPNQRRETIERGSQIIVSQSWRLARLAKDLLDVSRLSSGQFTLKCQSCNLVKVIKDLVEQVKPVAPFHKFQLDLPGEPL